MYKKNILKTYQMNIYINSNSVISICPKKPYFSDKNSKKTLFWVNFEVDYFQMAQTCAEFFFLNDSYIWLVYENDIKTTAPDC